MDSPSFEWGSSGDPQRGLPTSNVRGTSTSRPRTTLAGGWKWIPQEHGSCHCNGSSSASARIILYVMVDCGVAFSSFSEERSPASNLNLTLHSLNCRYKKGHLMQVAFLLNGSLRGWPTSNVRGTRTRRQCYCRRRVEAESFRNTFSTAETSQAMLESG